MIIYPEKANQIEGYFLLLLKVDIVSSSITRAPAVRDYFSYLIPFPDFSPNMHPTHLRDWEPVLLLCKYI